MPQRRLLAASHAVSRPGALSRAQSPAVGPEAVEGHPPRERAGDEDVAVGREDAAEAGVVLECRHEPVSRQREQPTGGA